MTDPRHLPRLVPDAPFPPYAHVPGRTPHPFSDPRGHGHGGPVVPPAPLDPARWHECPAYLYGLDLFNHGYYWEAHEVWEGLWRQADGPAADFLKALIKLAAAGVKAREGRPPGVVTHARRAAELLRRVTGPAFLGLAPADLVQFAEGVADGSALLSSPGPDGPVFAFHLWPTG